MTSPASKLLRDMTGQKYWRPLRPWTGTTSIGGSLARGLRVGGPAATALDAAALLYAMQNAPVCTPIL